MTLNANPSVIDDVGADPVGIYIVWLSATSSDATPNIKLLLHVSDPTIEGATV